MNGLASVQTLNELLIRTQPAHIQLATGREMEQRERNVIRADYVRKLSMKNAAGRRESELSGVRVLMAGARRRFRSMHDKFTERVRKVMYLAREEAAWLQHDYIGTEHLLLGVIREGEGIAATVLNNLGLDLDAIRQAVESMVAATGGTLTIGEIPFTPRAKRVLGAIGGRGAAAGPQLRRNRASAPRADSRG